jgi:hypothetical protein
MTNVGQQLDLFAGILLTQEQQEMVDKYIDTCNKNAVFYEKTNQRLENMLIDAGFIKGKDFVNDFKTKVATREVTLGNNYNNTRFETTVTCAEYNGGVRLKGVYFNTKELLEREFSVDFDKDKVQCTTVQDQYRFIKPTTLLEKLRNYNATQENTYNEYVKRNSLKDNVIEKYTKLYPNATVEVKNEYSKYSGSFQVIEVKFQSGSYVQFTLDTYNQAERLYKKYDAQFEKMDVNEVLNKFNNQ